MTPASAPTVVPAQAGGAVTVVGLVVLVIAVVTVYDAVEVVDATERRVLVVLGEARTVLEPGINFVPPFVSRTVPYPTGPREAEYAVEATAADGRRVAATVRVVTEVTDPMTCHEAGGDHGGETEAGARAATGAVVGDRELEAALSAHADVEAAVRDRLASLAPEYGVELREVDVLELVETDRPATGDGSLDADGGGTAATGDGTDDDRDLEYGTDFGDG